VKKRYIPFIIYLEVAFVLLIFMHYFNNLHVYGMAALEAAARWAVCFLVLIADVSVGVIHAIVLLILHIRKKKKAKE
jgi:hypothetical protein